MSKYTGDWRENKISGIGVYAWLDGRRFEGEWIENNMEGMGIYIWNDGRMYAGQYKDDKKHGFGVYTWADGRCYEGHWLKGKQHSLGKYKVPRDDKEKYGLWEDGKRIEWFSEEQVEQINNFTLDFRQYFTQRESSAMIDGALSFRKPENWDLHLNSVKRRIA